MGNIFSLRTGFLNKLEYPKWSVLYLFVIFVLLFLFELVLGMGLPLLFRGVSFYSIIGNIYRTISISLSIGLIAYLIYKIFGQDFCSLLTFGQYEFSYVKIITWFFLGVVMFLISYLIYFLFSGIALKAGSDSLNYKLLFSSIVLQIFVSAKEELLYRCIILQVLDKKKINRYIIIIVSALIFTLSHLFLYSSFALINIFFTGLLWALIVYNEKGIEIVFALHVSSNIMASVFLYLFDFSDWQVGAIFNGLTLIFFLIFQNSKMLRNIWETRMAS